MKSLQSLSHQRHTQGPENADPAISDYPDLITDSTALLSASRIVPELADSVGDACGLRVSYGEVGVNLGTNLTSEQAS